MDGSTNWSAYCKERENIYPCWELNLYMILNEAQRKKRNYSLKFGIFSMRYLCIYSFIHSKQTWRSVGRNEFRKVSTSCRCCQKARKYGSCVRLYLELSHTAAGILGVTAPIYSFIRPSTRFIQIPHQRHPSTHTVCWLGFKPHFTLPCP
jgi:hypothetical protein